MEHNRGKKNQKSSASMTSKNQNQNPKVSMTQNNAKQKHVPSTSPGPPPATTVISVQSERSKNLAQHQTKESSR